MLVPRPALAHLVRRRLKESPAVALLGPRQCGKSTLARSIAGDRAAAWFDLENPADVQALAEPLTALESLRGIVVIDEVQRRPELFPVLRVLLDRRPLRARFLLLGSAAPELLRQASETLAGRVALVQMTGFTLAETGVSSQRRLWLRGGFPRSWLARTERASFDWRADFIQTFLERDIPQMGIGVPAPSLRRFWAMAAHYSGGLWNGSEIGRALGESHTTVRRHLDVLVSTLVVRELQPWFENLGKRQVKSPKVYLRDSGLLHALLDIRTAVDLSRHPKAGASWEGFVIEQILATARGVDAYHWRTQAGAELDLLLVSGSRRTGVEIKLADAPRLTPSMTTAINDLALERLIVVYPGHRRYGLAPKAEVMSLAEALAELASARMRR